MCTRWNMLTRSPLLWKKVDVKLHPNRASSNDLATKLINQLPSCVTHIKLHFRPCRSYVEMLYFEEFCLKLQEKCPQLEMLFLQQTELSNDLPSVIDLCSKLLGKVKVLAFHYSIFSDCPAAGQSDVSKIEVLDITRCHFERFKVAQFSKMPHLKKLHLRNANENYPWFENDTSFLEHLEVLTVRNARIGSEIFQNISNHGHNLQELYLCYTDLIDNDLKFSDAVFPQLKTICLNLCYRVTCEGIVSFIQSCQSLENVYVDKEVAKCYAEHPFVTVNTCKSGIVKALSCSSHEKVDYFCEYNVAL